MDWKIFIACLSLLCACSIDLSRDPPTDDGGNNHNSNNVDSDARPPGDGPITDPDGPKPPVDLAKDLGPMPTTSVLQVVVNKLFLPEKDGKFAMDLDGNGDAENKLAAILGAVNATMPETFTSLQQSIDASIAKADTILLLDLLADNLTTSLARVSAFMGEDLDEDPADNFNGKEPFKVSPTTPKDMNLDGQLQGGELNAAGSVLAPLNLSEGTTTVIPLEKARIQATVTADKMEGMIAGAALMSDVENIIVHEIAIRLNELYTAPDATPDEITQLEFFDTDNNGTITVTDLMNNSLIALLIKPDVDTDGDNKMDAMSIGLGFAAVPCEIQP